jgi:ELWxxDGT repeat protein
LIFFEASTESFGREIWVTDKTKEPKLLKDINLGNKNSINGNFKNTATILNNSLYFIASDEFSAGELWKTDGTTNGTVKVTHFLNKNISKLTLVGNQLYFLVVNNYILEVWKSDGTETGTLLVLGNIPIWNSPTFQGKCNNTFIFTFQPYGSNNSKVWRSDGTSAGTYSITIEIGGNGAGPGGTSALTQYIEYKNELYFVVRSNSIFGYPQNVGIMKTDGTLEKTVPVKGIYSGSSDLIEYADVVEILGKLYFSFFDATLNRLILWESDGTSYGTKNILDKVSNRFFMTSNLTNIGGNLVFCGVNTKGGTSLLKMDLTNYSITDIKELQDSTKTPFMFLENTNNCRIRPISSGKCFISSPSTSNKKKGWISDLTAINTINIENLNNISDVFVSNESLYFSKSTTSEGAELWKSDGTQDNTILFQNINSSKYGFSNNNLTTLNNKLIFSGNDGLTGNEPWTYSEGKATQLKDIYSGMSSSSPNSFVKYNDLMYFTAYDVIHGFELWKTDGTPENTQIAFDIVSGTSSSRPTYLKVCNGNLFFIASINGHYNVCKTDGTTWEIVKDLGQNDYGVAFSVMELTNSGNYIYFVTEGVGQNLWISDGTEAGTYKLKDFVTCAKLTDVNGKLFFTAVELSNTELELWSTDGTIVGTKLVKDIGIGYSSAPNELIGFKNLLYFTAFTRENGREIWQSNGTADGTILLSDINTDSQDGIVSANFCVSNDKLFFSANNGTTGVELWKTDGTKSGTVLVSDINNGIESSCPTQITSINNQIYFQAYDNEHGLELWKSDGTTVGTVLVSDILSGLQSSSPTNIVSIGNDIYFIAETTNSGRQIFKMTYNTLQSISDISDDVTFRIFPNPCMDYLYFNSNISCSNIYIYGLSGQLILKPNIINNQVNVSGLNTGLYIVKFTSNSKEFIKTFMKQ